METIELHLRAFMMKLISLDGALGDIDVAEGEEEGKLQGILLPTDIHLSRYYLGRGTGYERWRRAADT